MLVRWMRERVFVIVTYLLYLCFIMPRTKNFDTVKKLPSNAIKVSEYARLQGWKGHSLVYHNITRNKANYKIVVFQDINFVIPN